MLVIRCLNLVVCYVMYIRCCSVLNVGWFGVRCWLFGVCMSVGVFVFSWLLVLFVVCCLLVYVGFVFCLQIVEL